MGKEEYVRKMEEKLNDPTQEIKQELVQQLKKLKDEGMIDEKMQKELSPGACQSSRVYRSPKVDKEGYTHFLRSLTVQIVWRKTSTNMYPRSSILTPSTMSMQ